MTIPASNHPTGSCFNVNIINDDSVESDEVFLLSLQVPADAAVLPGTTFITSVTIVDDDGWLHFAYIDSCACSTKVVSYYQATLGFKQRERQLMEWLVKTKVTYLC